jgi:hypothetical protein
VCGIAGLFVGCGVPPGGCPLQDLRAPAAAPAAYTPYVSAFDGWHERASVRTRPDRLAGATLDRRRLFPDRLIPILQHPLLQDSPEHIREAVRSRHLLRYLDFTLVLETDVVNPIALAIAHGRDGLSLPPRMRQDAFKVYCDEAYHAVFTSELLESLRGLADPTVRPSRAYFIERFLEIAAKSEPELRLPLRFLFVAISEMLITGTLQQLPDDGSVTEPVRLMVADHAADEARHHAFFSRYLEHFWQPLDRDRAVTLARLAPDLIACFLAPDLDSLYAELGTYGFSRDDRWRILAETFENPRVRRQRARMARPVVAGFTRLGILEVPEVRDRFRAHGLLPERAR